MRSSTEPWRVPSSPRAAPATAPRRPATDRGVPVAGGPRSGRPWPGPPDCRAGHLLRCGSPCAIGAYWPPAAVPGPRDAEPGTAPMVATVVNLTSVSSTVRYFEQDGYYAKGSREHRRATRWHGAGAAALGLQGYVDPEVFSAVLDGQVPGTDVVLGSIRDGERVHRAGPRRHPVGAEVGLIARAGLRRPSGPPGPRHGGARDPRLHRGRPAPDPPLEPGLPAGGAGTRRRAGRRDLPARHQPESRPAAPHPLRDRQHDPRRPGPVAQPGTPAPAPREAPGGRVLPGPARNPSAGRWASRSGRR